MRVLRVHDDLQRFGILEMGSGADKDSGRLWLDGDVVCYESKAYACWRLRVAALRIIGEATNQNGPGADDYFICFLTDASGCWNEASFYADGRDECLKRLGERLGGELELQLCASTDFTSRILWPPRLAGQPLFEFREKVPHGAWQRLKSTLLSGNLQTISRSLLADLRSSRDLPHVGGEHAEAHRHSIGNRAEVLASQSCGCFHCLEIFAPEDITEWVKERDGGEETALCPNCGVDAVIGSASGVPITGDFLADMRRIHFAS